MLTNHSKRLAKLETKTRAQWESVSEQYWKELFARFSWSERDTAKLALQKWFDSPLEHKVDEAAMQEYFTEEEMGFLQRVDAILKEPHFETMREMIDTLYTALQACERVRV